MANTPENCTHDCSTCSANCASKNQSRESLLEPANPFTSVKNIVAIVSGKGGVGKSLVTSMMAVETSRKDYKTAILDADITGPSIPKIFGVSEDIEGDENGMFPVKSTTGIRMMSTNLLLQNDTDPVVWRGSMISGVVKQFWSGTCWGDLDYMYVDMPPGTGDVPLTVFQSLPVSGIIIVTSPQDLVSMIVAKAVNMAKMMNIPILGIIENYSYFECPDCGKRHSIYGQSHIEEVAAQFGIDVLAKLPIDPKLPALCDRGLIELMENNYVTSAFDIIDKKLSEKK